MHKIMLCETLFNFRHDVTIFSVVIQSSKISEKDYNSKARKGLLEETGQLYLHSFLSYALVNITFTCIPLERQRQIRNTCLIY